MARYEKGHRYRCPEAGCGCVIEVIEGAPSDCSGTHVPRCCCGRDMVTTESAG